MPRSHRTDQPAPNVLLAPFSLNTLHKSERPIGRDFTLSDSMGGYGLAHYNFKGADTFGRANEKAQRINRNITERRSGNQHPGDQGNQRKTRLLHH